jgi:hypothetical protein
MKSVFFKKYFATFFKVATILMRQEICLAHAAVGTCLKKSSKEKFFYKSAKITCMVYLYRCLGCLEIFKKERRRSRQDMHANWVCNIDAVELSEQEITDKSANL